MTVWFKKLIVEKNIVDFTASNHLELHAKEVRLGGKITQVKNLFFFQIFRSTLWEWTSIALEIVNCIDFEDLVLRRNLTYSENEKVSDMKDIDSDSKISELLQSIYEIVDTTDPLKSIKTVAAVGMSLRRCVGLQGFEIKLVELKRILSPINSWM